ncbi:MAG: uracil-DNA glycosylase [Nitrospirae bacterium]|nr:uracil-DNA glycosylase [Nitrospirota bacterium]
MNLDIADIKHLLAYYQALGFDDLPIALCTKRNTAQEPDAHMDAVDKSSLLEDLRAEIGDCQRCKLAKHRSNIVFGAGSPSARLIFIGEAPGKEEDLQGLPFVGDAGTLLTRLILKMGMKREDVYIANIIKCRPPMNRDPEEDEIATCRKFIERQIQIIRPQIIMTLGRIALQALMDMPNLRITSARGHFYDYHGIPLMPTFHPAYLLRNPKDKVLTWADAQKVMAKIAHTSTGGTAS